MEHAGITTYEPTWLHVALLVIPLALATYPLTVILVLGGALPRWPRGNRLVSAIAVATEVARIQLRGAVIAYIFCAAASFVLGMACVLVGGLLVWSGLMEPVDQLITTPVLVGMGLIHLVGQGAAYMIALKSLRP